MVYIRQNWSGGKKKTCNHSDCSLLSMDHVQGQAHSPGSYPSYNVWGSLQSMVEESCGNHKYTQVQNLQCSYWKSHLLAKTAALSPSEAICLICAVWFLYGPERKEKRKPPIVQRSRQLSNYSSPVGAWFQVKTPWANKVIRRNK